MYCASDTCIGSQLQSAAWFPHTYLHPSLTFPIALFTRSTMGMFQKPQPPMFYFGGKHITATIDMLLNKLHLTVYHLELEEPCFGLPETVIVKQQKNGRKSEIFNEISTYKKLQKLQGTVIPTLFGKGSLNGRPALVLSEV
ncbi:hypothetical protein PENFLA_c030G05100 [Penicillium flavigenum]|uniref:Uncharacterized protein n=1 Tax=Penicillium flavigenum TaxID=254877 RepID=A0A1V6SQH1_9EURO|nr:hypothetical protein PENFLA_c030G05100 [Penicillium flavigenum]